MLGEALRQLIDGEADKRTRANVLEVEVIESESLAEVIELGLVDNGRVCRGVTDKDHFRRTRRILSAIDRRERKGGRMMVVVGAEREAIRQQFIAVVVGDLDDLNHLLHGSAHNGDLGA